MARPYRINTEKTRLETEREIRAEFKAWGVTEHDIEVDAKTGRSVVRWIPAGGSRAVELESIDQDGARNNLRKLFLCIEALRMNERRGVGGLVATYYAQTTAIVEHASTVADRYAPYAVLDLAVNADRETVDAVTRTKLRKAHPDAGGSAAEAARINDARDAIYRERGWK